MNKILKLLPEWLKEILRQVRDTIFSLLYAGNKRWCPVCGKHSRKFRKYGETGRDDAVCVHCNSLERHRFVWQYFLTRTDLFKSKSKKFLHIAPERCFRKRLPKLVGEGYLSADLFDPRVMVNMDITAIQYHDETFDAVYCSHVLEHVNEDRKALSEFYRILKKTGWAIFMVPVTVEKTIEDPSITDPQERKKMFGQEDHVRRYGPDFTERIIEAGFTVQVTNATEMFTEEETRYMGLKVNEDIFYCTKT